MTFTVAALYRFAPFDDPAALRQPLIDLCAAQGVKGTLLLAREGVNGTIAGSADGVAAVIAHIRALPGCAELDVKYSTAADDAVPAAEGAAEEGNRDVEGRGARPGARCGALCRSRRLECAGRRSGHGADRHAQRVRGRVWQFRRRGRSRDEKLWRIPRLVARQCRAVCGQARRDVLYRRHSLRKIDRVSAA